MLSSLQLYRADISSSNGLPWSSSGVKAAVCKGKMKPFRPYIKNSMVLIFCQLASFVMQFPGGKAAVCEGEIKSFGAKFIKAKGKRVAIFKKGGCLGTSSIIGLNKSDDESAQGLQWPSSLPQVC